MSRGTLQFISIVFIVAVMYAHVGISLANMWWVSDDYSHGFLIPFISLYMVWHKRKSLELIDTAPSIAGGILLVLLAGSMLIAGSMGGVVLLEEISLIVMILGIVLLFWGLSFLKKVALPVFYLIFMIKIFAEGSESFHWPFQLVAVNIGIKLLALAGVPVFQEAQFLQLPNITLEVASACSGVRFLVSIIAIGIPLAIFTQRSWGKRVFLVSFGVVTAIIVNGLRVALIGIWAYNGHAVVHGPMHIFQGVFVAWFGFIALFAMAWLLRDKTQAAPTTHPRGQELRAFFQTTVLRPFTGRNPLWLWLVPLILLSGLTSYYYFHDVKSRQMDNRLNAFPKEFAAWRGEDKSPLGEYFRAIGADKEILRMYSDGAGEGINLYIGHFGRQQDDKKLVGYQTSWKFHRNESRIKLALDDGSTYTVNSAILKNMNERRFVIFWYDIRGRVIADRYMAKALTLLNAAFANRSDGALIVVSAPVEAITDMSSISEKSKDFAREVIARTQKTETNYEYH